VRPLAISLRFCEDRFLASNASGRQDGKRRLHRLKGCLQAINDRSPPGAAIAGA